MTSINSSCAYCGVGCGVEVSSNLDQALPLATHQIDSLSLTGMAKHPANLGRLCAKGENLLASIEQPTNLLYPQDASGKSISWNDAINTISQRFNEVISEHGPQAVAFYLSGQLLTEDYYVANKLAKGFIGTANVDTNSRLCMSSAVSAHQRAFGEDVVSGNYQDFEQARVIVLVGSNAAWTHPVLFQRMLAARSANGTKIVVVDPMASATAKQADVHLAIKPGCDHHLFNGLLSYLAKHDLIDAPYIQAHTEHFDQAIQQIATDYQDADIAKLTGLSADQVLAFYQLFVAHQQVITASCQGVNQSTLGTDTTNAIINCHLARGQVGKPGSGFFSLTGQPNAMGGREVGGLATQLACHLGFADKERSLVAEHWEAPNIVGHKGLTAVEMFDAVASGEIKAIWVLGTNPAASLPDSHNVSKALADCPFVVVSDVTADTDTAKLADLLLPALPWSQKDGTVTNSERTISRQRGFVIPKGEAKADWWSLAQVANAMGYAGFEYQSAYDVFVEHAQLSSKVKQAYPYKAFDISGLASISYEQYQALKPTQWPINDTSQEGTTDRRVFTDGQFATETGKAQFVYSKQTNLERSPSPINKQNQLLLNSGRSRDQWHTMTRTGHIAKLRGHQVEPTIAMSQATANRVGVSQDQLILCQPVVNCVNEDYVSTKNNATIARVEIDSSISVDSAFMSMHWTKQFSRAGGVNQALDSRYDPYSKQPGFKHQTVEILEAGIKLQGTLFGTLDYAQTSVYQVQHTLYSGSCVHLGFAVDHVSLLSSQRSLSWTVSLPQQQIKVACVTENNCLSGLLLTSQAKVNVDLEAVAALIGHELAPDLLKTLHSLIRAGNSPLVCSCTGVSVADIDAAVHQQLDNQVFESGIKSADFGKALDAVQSNLGCGRQCGSCNSEVKQCAADSWQIALGEMQPYQAEKPAKEDVA
ncbi:nitrate reductase [Shewanella maritima]|uniref:Nitrate reductase n=1 Tax=Shewanella maritima TaxID=2520507 RepID=A0A411PD70_9GAMM|nr:molybdopterin-dependent oxidoreductase [Shewanella maritima]QBF81392.1 nitrate reductase [Shewanella maritima]